MTAEPTTTALLLVTLGTLMGLSVAFSRAAGRLGVPVVLLFIVLGVLAGEDGLVGIHFGDYGFALRLGIVSLVLILFDGGLNTPLASAKVALGPAAVLATVGVVGTALVLALFAWLLGFEWKHALLLGAVVSSTDAAAVFSVLRGTGLALRKRMGLTLELESGLNDPMAVILTLALTASLVSGERLGFGVLAHAALEMAVGAAAGIAVGMGGRWVLRTMPLPAGGLYPVLTLSLAFVAFGLPTLAHGSGFLAVYIASILLGSETIRYRSGVLRVHDALAWLSQVTMFLVLGLLVTPSELVPLAWQGVVLGLVLALVARPLVVFLCLLPFRFPAKESLYIGWAGLRGAVPIILATFPILAGAPGAKAIFNTVFIIVVVTTLLPGATVPWLTRKLGLVAETAPPSPAVLEIHSTQILQGELVSFYIGKAAAAAGAALSDLPFPASATATLIVRDKELLAPRGTTVLAAGDHVYVFCQKSDLPLLQLLLGRAEED